MDDPSQANGRGTERALRVLIPNRAMLIAYAYSIVGDWNAAEDVFQELAVLVTRKGAEIPDNGKALAWLKTAARYEALKARRKLKRHAVPLDDETLALLEPHWDAHEAPAAGNLVDFLRECLGKLTDRARKLLTLRYAEELGCQDIASRVGGSMNTIYVALSRAHKVLADCINKRRAREECGNA